MREALAGELFAARSAAERIGPAARARARRRARRTARARSAAALELAALEEAAARAGRGAAGERVAALERELESLDAEREGRLERELAELARERDAAAKRLTELQGVTAQRREAVEAAERAAEQAREARREAERAVEAARRDAASVGAELATVNQFLSRAAAAPGGARALAEDLGVEPGYELAVAAALGPLLSAGVVDDLGEGERLLDGASRDGAVALIADFAPSGPVGVAGPPVDDARPLLSLVKPEGRAKAVAERLLRGAWLVDSLDAAPARLRRHRGYADGPRADRRHRRAAPGRLGRPGARARAAQPPRRADRRNRGRRRRASSTAREALSTGQGRVAAVPTRSATTPRVPPAPPAATRRRPPRRSAAPSG